MGTTDSLLAGVFRAERADDSRDCGERGGGGRRRRSWWWGRGAMTTIDATTTTTTTIECDDDDDRMRPRRKNNAMSAPRCAREDTSVPRCAREDTCERRDAANEREEYWTDWLYELLFFSFVIQTFFWLFGMEKKSAAIALLCTNPRTGTLSRTPGSHAPCMTSPTTR